MRSRHGHARRQGGAPSICREANGSGSSPLDRRRQAEQISAADPERRTRQAMSPMLEVARADAQGAIYGMSRFRGPSSARSLGSGGASKVPARTRPGSRVRPAAGTWRRDPPRRRGGAAIDSPRDAMRQGIAFLPKHREAHAIIHNRSVADNAVISGLPSFAGRLGFLDIRRWPSPRPSSCRQAGGENSKRSDDHRAISLGATSRKY